jgi:hypothetical protein
MFEFEQAVTKHSAPERNPVIPPGVSVRMLLRRVQLKTASVAIWRFLQKINVHLLMNGVSGMRTTLGSLDR